MSFLIFPFQKWVSMFVSRFDNMWVIHKFVNLLSITFNNHVTSFFLNFILLCNCEKCDYQCSKFSILLKMQNLPMIENLKMNNFFPNFTPIQNIRPHWIQWYVKKTNKDPKMLTIFNIFTFAKNLHSLVDLKKWKQS
jgi:hypothetical protein